MNDESSCKEYERSAGTTRRRFLAGMAAGTGLGVASTAFGGVFRQAVFGVGNANNVVVVISLRGGIDGLSVVVPHADDNYYALRPGIGVPIGSLICKDTQFGLHPSLGALQPFWDRGELAAVQAVGMRVPDRSHFSAMETIEDADPGSAVRRGWINRAIGLDSDAFPTEAVQFGTSVVPTSLTGRAPTLATPSIKELYLAGADPQWDDETWQARRRTQLETVWNPAPGPLGVAGRSALSTVSQMAPHAREEYVPHNGAVYPTAWPATDLSLALKDTAQLIRADVGTEVVAIDYGSWDMHTELGTTEWGDMQTMLRGLANALTAFLTDLGGDSSRVTVVTLSEFGRRVAENGGGGLDHGWGNMMLVAGGGVSGGRYYGSWPGLGDADLSEGDLKVTTDYRNVLGEVVENRLGRAATAVFPGLDYRALGMVTG